VGEAHKFQSIFAAVVPPAKEANFYEVYLVNASELDLAAVENFSGATLEGDQLATTTRNLGPLAGGKALLLDQLSQHDLDFACWYNLNLRLSDGVELKAFFQITKGYDLSADRLRFCPPLGRNAYHFELRPKP
jgi:hypothetical protein